MACDYAINPLLLDARFTLPKDVLIDHRFRGMSAERIYNLIEEQGTAQSEPSASGEPSPEGVLNQASQPDQGGSEPNAPVTPGGFAQVLDAPEPEGDDGDTVAEQAREWKIAVEQAENVAKLAGNCRLV
jgi:hypothetical protein